PVVPQFEKPVGAKKSRIDPIPTWSTNLVQLNLSRQGLLLQLMEVKTETNYRILDVLRDRWSPKAFAPGHEIPEGDIYRLFEAARWAPSSFNEQPWRFIAAQRANQESFDRILRCLSEKNQMWAQNCSLLVLTLAKLRFDRTGKVNRHAWYDLGASAFALTMQATKLGLLVHQMAGFSPEKAREEFDISDEFEPASVMAIGYLGKKDDLPDDVKPRDRNARHRLDLDDILTVL
ncbi:MAG: nitroreductase family protein, partial [Saprospiraceae bacterium]|nr:nitroreductase family protein [Saprospiraceae bacterium]